jgi:ubiquinone/menaquinone biosynthesis C-methylase UbiE
MMTVPIDRGFAARNRRVRSLDVESYQDFVIGFRDWTYGDLDKSAQASASEILKELRINAEEAPLSAFRDKFLEDQAIATRLRCWMSSQQLMWQNIQDHYSQHEDFYLDGFDAVDDTGPGSLELNTGMEMPEYTMHEIHVQPGGYTGNDFAGPIFHYGTNTFYKGQNNEDQLHIELAKTVTKPADGKVDRIVEIGCGIGRFSVALAEEFPDAEVWGIDVGGPLVRYAHARAVELGVPVHFAQRLAEDSKFDDNSVDLAAAYILFHEVSAEGAVDICKEMFRILRPGGVFEVIDFNTGNAHHKEPYRRFMGWIDHVYNAERWSHQFIATDFLETLASAGFEAEKGEDRHWGIATYIARKPE